MKLDLEAGTADVSYCIIQGQTNFVGAGNMPWDPLFRRNGRDDYQISLYSPAIDAGDNTAQAGTLDLVGHPRVTGSSIDLGAWEGLSLAVDKLSFYSLPASQQLCDGGAARFSVTNGPGNTDRIVWKYFECCRPGRHSHPR